MALNEFQKRSKAGFPIDAIRNDSKVRLEITLDTYEFTWNCPSTNAPDFGKVIITYTPDKRIAETKALKYYLMKYRYLNAFNEELTNRILLDFIYFINPKKVKVVLAQNPRGGTANTCTGEWDSSNEDDVESYARLNYTPKKDFRGGWPMLVDKAPAK